MTDRETASSNAQPSEKAKEHRNSKTSPFLFNWEGTEQAALVLEAAPGNVNSALF